MNSSERKRRRKRRQWSMKFPLILAFLLESTNTTTEYSVNAELRPKHGLLTIATITFNKWR